MGSGIPAQQELFFALFSVYHQIALRRDDHGFAAWRKAGGAKLPALSIRKAIEVLKNISGRTDLDPGTQTHKALRLVSVSGLGQLYWLDQDEQRQNGKNRLKQADSANESLSWLSKELPEALQSLLPPTEGDEGDRLREISTASNVDRAWEVSAEMLNVPLGYRITRAELDRCGVTHIGIELRSSKALADFAAGSDPRNWATVAAVGFRETYQVTSTNLPSATSQPPASQAPAGPPWSGQLFEDAGLDLWPGAVATSFRNLLNIDFTTGSTQVSTKYSLFESLTNQVLGQVNFGGLDVDSGEGRAEVDSVAGGLRLSVTKDVRFTETLPMFQLFNLSALPFLTWWLSYLWLGAAAL